MSDATEGFRTTRLAASRNKPKPRTSNCGVSRDAPDHIPSLRAETDFPLEPAHCPLLMTPHSSPPTGHLSPPQRSEIVTKHDITSSKPKKQTSPVIMASGSKEDSPFPNGVEIVFFAHATGCPGRLTARLQTTRQCFFPHFLLPTESCSPIRTEKNYKPGAKKEEGKSFLPRSRLFRNAAHPVLPGDR